MAGDDRVMVATDLSARSDRPFERAFILADQLGGSVVVLHVVEGKREVSEEDRERLLDLIDEEFGACPANSEIVLETGPVLATIVRLAEEKDCSIVITGVARFNSPVDYVLGTAVDALVRRSRVPVLVVKRKPHGAYCRLLVGTDFSKGSRRALITAAKLFPDAQLRLIHVFQSSYDAFIAQETTADYLRTEAQDEMKAFTAALPDAVRERVEPVLVQGHLAGSIEDEIRTWRADLLVLGTHGRSGFAQATIGSQAADLLEYEQCDVLTVREVD